MTNEILAPEILAHTTVARDLVVGDLAVWVDYKGREIGCRVTQVWAPGELGGTLHQNRTAHYRVVCCGLTVPAPYHIGFEIVVEAKQIRRAC